MFDFSKLPGSIIDAAADGAGAVADAAHDVDLTAQHVAGWWNYDARATGAELRTDGGRLDGELAAGHYGAAAGALGTEMYDAGAGIARVGADSIDSEARGALAVGGDLVSGAGKAAHDLFSWITP